eukprot:g19882.t1
MQEYAKGDEALKIHLFHCKVAAHQQDWGSFGDPLTHCLFRFIEESFENQFGMTLPDKITAEWLLCSFPTTREDADGGALIVKLVAEAVENPVECAKQWRQDADRLTEWGGLGIGEKRKWTKPILDVRKNTIKALLENLRDTFTRQALSPQSRRTGASGGGRLLSQAPRQTSPASRDTAASASSPAAGSSSTDPQASRDVDVSPAENGVQDDDVDVDVDEEDEELEIEREWADLGLGNTGEKPLLTRNDPVQ